MLKDAFSRSSLPNSGRRYGERIISLGHEGEHLSAWVYGKWSLSNMQVKKILMKAGMVAALSALAACASNNTTPVAAEKPIAPRQAEAPAPKGPVPGSIEDLKQNAGNMVYFDYDQYTLTAQAEAVLRRQAAWLKEYPETRIRLAGNCDERGTREYNLALGARRANAAKAFLASQGVDPARISTISYGKERPIDPRSNEAAWSKNRNATTLLVTTGSGS